MLRRTREWDKLFDEDPAAGLLNLFDVWIAFAAALLLATVSYHSRPQTGKENVDRSIKIDRYRPSAEQLTGNGQRLGTAYRLANGEVVYVPEGQQDQKPKP